MDIFKHTLGSLRRHDSERSNGRRYNGGRCGCRSLGSLEYSWCWMRVHCSMLGIESGARLTSSSAKSVLDFIAGNIEMRWVQSAIFVKWSVHGMFKGRG